MNKLEKVFYNHLLSKGIKEHEIEFFIADSPDFIVKGKIGYEVKRIMGERKKNIILNKKQIEKILNKQIKSFIIPIDFKENIFKRIPITKGIFDKKESEGIKIIIKNEETIGLKIDSKLLRAWKDTIFRNEGINRRFTKLIKKDTIEYEKKLGEKFGGKK